MIPPSFGGGAFLAPSSRAPQRACSQTKLEIAEDALGLAKLSEWKWLLCWADFLRGGTLDGVLRRFFFLIAFIDNDLYVSIALEKKDGPPN